MRRAWMTTVVVLAAMPVGCGDKEPTAAQKRAAKERWVQHVDAACRKATDAIADRGYPANLVDLDRLVVRGIEDMRAAIAAIAHERVPIGTDRRPAAFVREMRALEPELEKFSGVSEELKTHALINAADSLKPRLVRVQEAAEKAGLHDCKTEDARWVVPAAVRAPVFAEQYNRLESRVLRRLRAVRKGAREVDTPAEYGNLLDRYSVILTRALDGIDRLDPPLWASEQTANYQRALRDLQSVVQLFSAQIDADRGKPLYSLDRKTYMRLLRKLERVSKAEGKAHRKMIRAVGAAPTTPGDSGGGQSVEPDSTQES